jgi:hypothetical protein
MILTWMAAAGCSYELAGKIKIVAQDGLRPFLWQWSGGIVEVPNSDDRGNGGLTEMPSKWA